MKRADELDRLERLVSVARRDTEARGETFYPGPSRVHLAAFPPRERWEDWVELDSKAWPERRERRYTLVPTTCFNCESACGLLAYVDKDTLEVRKFEGNPEHPGSRGRNCAKGPATLNQVVDPDRVLYPLKRAGARGEGKWVRVSWDEALDDIAGRIRRALREGRHREIMYHVGRPGEDGFTERVMAAWGVDGHNSHTNICSSGARAGYQFWLGMDRPSPDHARADVILLVSSHLEAGHYFNPHAQRILEGVHAGAKLIVFDTRLSNTATHADHWLPTQPGSEAAVLLAIANHLIQTETYDREFVRRWFNWEAYLAAEKPEVPRTFESFEATLKELYAECTFEWAAAESGVDAEQLREVAEIVSRAGSRLSTHNWRSAASGNEGGWQVSRTLFFLNALTGSVATPGGTYPSAWNKFVPKPIRLPRHPEHWNDLTWPDEFPLAMYEMSFLLPHILKEGRGRLDVYFTRVYNPVWTNPDGFTWIEALSDEAQVGLHVALTPTWNETAYFADYVLPMGHGPERHDIHSYETHDGQWLGFRQPVLRTARERLGEGTPDTRHANPGEVWEENEFWLELSWRIDPDGELGIRPFVESDREPGTRLTADEYYEWIFEHSVPGLPEAAAEQGLTPLEYMRRYGAFEVERDVGPLYEREVPAAELDDTAEDEYGRVYTRAPKPESPNLAPTGAPEADEDGRRPVGVRVDDRILRGFPTPSGKLEFYSPTLVEWGWPEYAMPTYIRSHVHPEAMDDDQMCLISTFRLPVQIHTRSANSKWLDEIPHTNPLWHHRTDAERLGVRTGSLVRVETEIGHFVLKAWVTESIKPGVVACSHHMGRWKLATGSAIGGEPDAGLGEQPEQAGQRQLMATVGLDHKKDEWKLTRKKGAAAYESSDRDTSRIWWTDVGVHQNLTFPVHPDPISGMHCWHQAVRVKKASLRDRYGDIVVDTEKAHHVYLRWLEKTREASAHSPDGTRRPHWLIRPVRPVRAAYDLPE
ncbi:MAG: molybdopterin-dependent oxidoreductase [Gemmatimonadetes bacterium]|nr:molybdopterin-dependent oxidoreductase [Gemmatimonadota bacterium]